MSVKHRDWNRLLNILVYWPIFNGFVRTARVEANLILKNTERTRKTHRKKNVTREIGDVSAIYEYEILTQFHRWEPNEIKKKRNV